MYAPTIRHHKGTFYVICEYLGLEPGIMGVVFNTKTPLDETTWSDPVVFRPTQIDPDLFWDDDGTVYTATHGIYLEKLNLKTGELTDKINIWNGTGGVWPEGPHIYKKDGWYYLLIAEGGTGSDHAVTIARSKKITGPYEGYEKNPILTNRGTSEYFQNVGHADLFQDTKGNWWGMSLAVRLGPQRTQPMGREAVLFNVTWTKGEWPILQPVRGRMNVPWLPKETRSLPGSGPFNEDPDDYKFSKGSAIPKNLVYWRVPQPGTFTTTGKGLQILPSRGNLTGDQSSWDLSGRKGLSFIGRRQTHTLFTFTLDLTLDLQQDGQEAGITIFRTQQDHADLGIVRLPQGQGNEKAGLGFRFRAEGPNRPGTKIVPVPQGWEKGSIRLQIKATTSTDFEFSAMAASKPQTKINIGTASALVVSGGSGEFVGSLLGAYATCNGEGSGEKCPEGGSLFVKHWRYKGDSQQISHDEFIPA